MNIYYLASENNKSLSGNSRVFSNDKTLILKKCWLSLQLNVEEDDRIFLIDGGLSDLTKKWLVDNSNCLISVVEKSKKEEKYSFLYTALQTIENNIEDSSHFLVEDDYLFVYDALKVIKSSLKHWNRFGVPEDDPIKYKNFDSYTINFIGNDRHWRQVNLAGWTVFGNSSVWKKHLQDLKAFYQNSEVDTKNIFTQLFRSYSINNPCAICPLPGVATHLKEDRMTPLINWEYVWNQFEI